MWGTAGLLPAPPLCPILMLVILEPNQPNPPPPPLSPPFPPTRFPYFARSSGCGVPSPADTNSERKYQNIKSGLSSPVSGALGWLHCGLRQGGKQGNRVEEMRFGGGGGGGVLDWLGSGFTTISIRHKAGRKVAYPTRTSTVGAWVRGHWGISRGPLARAI